MIDDEYHPELAGYVPSEGRSVRHPMTVKLLRVVIVIGVVALVLPGVIYTIGVQMQTADAACRIVVRAGDVEATGAIARFQPWGGNGPGWYCYSQSFDGSELMLRALGLIPGLSYQPSGTPA
ncbi:MAG: hypothetical protein M3N46_08525 [Actinomycetota bacterium]|nr:hypothetical protein [Actinomycetota bacterium]